MNVTTQEAAQILGISVKTVRQRVKRGHSPEPSSLTPAAAD